MICVRWGRFTGLAPHDGLIANGYGLQQRRAGAPKPRLGLHRYCRPGKQARPIRRPFPPLHRPGTAEYLPEADGVGAPALQLAQRGTVKLTAAVAGLVVNAAVGRWRDHCQVGQLTQADAGERVMSSHSWNRRSRSWRYASAMSRCRPGQKCPRMGPYADRNRCAWAADLNRRIARSRCRVGWCEFSARLFSHLCWRCSTLRRVSRIAAP